MSGFADIPVLLFVGLLGAAIFIVTYALVAWDVIDSRSCVYFALNFIGISMALSSHLISLNPASAIIQSFVLVISGVGFLKRYWKEFRRRERSGSRGDVALSRRAASRPAE